MAYDLVIVGAGPAGLTAGVYALQRKLKTLIIDAGEAGGQLINIYPEKVIANYPSVTEVHAHELGWSMVDHAKTSGCEIHEHEVVHDIVDKGDGLVVISDKGEYETKTVILSIGTGLFQPKKLGAPGEDRLEGKGVFYKLPEKKDLAGKRIVFAGGGNSALEMALLASDGLRSTSSTVGTASGPMVASSTGSWPRTSKPSCPPRSRRSWARTRWKGSS